MKWADLIEAERELVGPALVEAELRYAAADPSGMPPPPVHDESECEVCAARVEALMVVLVAD